MERGQYLMSMKFRPMSRSSSDAALFWPFGAAFQGRERMLAMEEDQCRGGGCITWPPRSYSCSFCGREFKSAQALGGHMNVHRRDRARLKQHSLSSSSSTTDDHHHQNPKNSPQEDPRKHKTGAKRDLNDVNHDANHDNHDANHDNNDDDDDDDDENVLERYYNEVRTELSVGLSSEFVSRKKAKRDVSRLPMMVGLVLGVSKINGRDEELDLELRLGVDPTKVN